MDFISDLLERHGCRRSFFVVGEIAKNHPSFISDLAESGHEIASHGLSWSHLGLRELNGGGVKLEMTESKDILKSVKGKEVLGFRAPAFSLDESVLEAAKDAGI